MADIFGIDLAYVALFVTMIGVGASVVFSSWANRRATVKDVKDHTDLKMRHTDLKIDALETKMEAKLETIEYKITNHENLLVEIKKVNKDEILLIRSELQSLRDEVDRIKRDSPNENPLRAEMIERRILEMEKKVELLMRRAWESQNREQKQSSKE